ncbi:dynein light chain Tctex-type protein 2B [Drosophila obscura]|uniref:dynein light chain Tctex-type protein 2B n=1 Tax=Drosophila obscura TaxID=7282 RepID=UPI001BB22808|nr:dynein light chain Tctex-type protein 2B [Drosophila obscura]
MSQSKPKSGSIAENKREEQTQESLGSGDVLAEGKPDATPNTSIIVEHADSAGGGAIHEEIRPAKDVTIYNAYNMGPAFGNKFPCPYIRYILQRVLTERLTNKSYAASDAVKWTREIADDINMKMKGQGQYPRYKHVVNVMLYQQNGGGCFYGARAIWDLLSDDYVSYVFDGGSFVCIASVFGCYTY